MVEYICRSPQTRLKLGKVIFDAQRLHGRKLFELVPNKTDFVKQAEDSFEDYEDEALLKDQQHIVAEFLTSRLARISFFKKF